MYIFVYFLFSANMHSLCEAKKLNLPTRSSQYPQVLDKIILNYFFFDNLQNLQFILRTDYDARVLRKFQSRQLLFDTRKCLAYYNTEIFPCCKMVDTLYFYYTAAGRSPVLEYIIFKRIMRWKKKRTYVHLAILPSLVSYNDFASSVRPDPRTLVDIPYQPGTRSLAVLCQLDHRLAHRTAARRLPK